MSERRNINKAHPDYPQYIEKCRMMSDAFLAEYRAAEAAAQNKYPNWRGLDHPESRKFNEIKKRLHKALEKLKKEYWYLFE